MPIGISHDPRELLVRRKFFSLRPQPLEQWLWKQGIAPSAERVFWLHWQEGMRNRDWCSSIPLKRVATLCSLDISSVTRAYQLLAKLGLIRRQDPGRDASRPFERAVCITEVRVPRELLHELGRFPDRTSNRVPIAAAATPAIEPTPEQGAASVAQPMATTTDPFKGLPARERQRALGALLAQLSAHERRQYHEALRLHQPHISFDPNSRLQAQGRALLLQFLQIAAAKPLPATSIAASAAASPPKPVVRKLTVFELARLRRELHATTGIERATELLREIVWAVEQGALSRFTSLHGMRIALKKVREGAWTRPNRMPPNWSRELAHCELCRTA
jgi:hypothetical protein